MDRLSEENEGILFIDFNLKSSSIDRKLHFKNCTFAGALNLENAKITRNMSFEGCHFQSPVNFRGAATPNRLRFSQCVFDDVFSLAAGDVSRMGSKDLWHLKFEDCIFNSYTTFNNRELQRSMVLSRCQFKEPPSFLNVDTHNGLNLEDCIFDIPSDTALLRRSERSFRALRLHAKANDDHELVAELVGHTMQCRLRNPNTPRLEKSLILAYRTFSDYGRSLVRPLTVVAIMAALVAMTMLIVDGTWTERVVFSTIHFTLQQMFDPYSALSPSYRAPVALSNIASRGLLILPLLGILVSSTVLIALITLGFAIRRRFDR
jgi:hypothetical protein